MTPLTITTVNECWNLTDPHGHLDAWDANYHHPTQTEANTYRQSLNDDGGDRPLDQYTPVRITECPVISCLCGAQVHYQTHADAEAELAQFGAGWCCPRCQ